MIFTSAAEYLAPLLKEKMPSADFVFLNKNKESKRFFPDGEIYARLACADRLKKQRVIVLHSGSPNPNEGIIELELILQILKDHQIEPEVFFTYFPYGRQDKAFLEGETNAAENLLKKLVDYYKVKKIYAIDPHFGEMPWAEKYPLASVSAIPFLMQEAKKDLGPDMLFLSPDKGGKRRTGLAGFNKTRLDSFDVVLASSDIKFQGRVVGAVDDILATGGTLCRFYDSAKAAGAEKIVALISHGPMPAGIERVKSTFSKLYLANTINAKEANIDISGLIAQSLSEGIKII